MYEEAEATSHVFFLYVGGVRQPYSRLRDIPFAYATRVLHLSSSTQRRLRDRSLASVVRVYQDSICECLASQKNRCDSAVRVVFSSFCQSSSAKSPASPQYFGHYKLYVVVVPASGCLWCLRGRVISALLVLRSCKEPPLIPSSTCCGEVRDFHRLKVSIEPAPTVFLLRFDEDNGLCLFAY